MEKRLKKYLKNGKFNNVSSIRSKTMSAIRGKNNRSTEVKLKMALIRNGISGFRLHASELPGNIDFYFKNKSIAIFVDGCYWHGCPKCGHIPKTRSKFWSAKILRNKQRDKTNDRLLKGMNIKSMRIWEHTLEDKKQLTSTINKIKKEVM